MKRVLVTGATGFIGSACLPRLASRGYEVHAISSRPHASPGDIRWHQCNLLDHGRAAEAVAAVRPSHLLHLAWIDDTGLGARKPPDEDPASVVSDNAKLRQATGWQTRTDLRSGIARTFDYWRNRGISTRTSE